MKRREFLKNASFTAVGIGVFGTVTASGDKFVGNTINTTDILGPFYRPNAPFRTNINPDGFAGNKLNLKGTIFTKDQKPASKCLIEVWQARADGFYDNVSDDFTYRASQYADKKGNYNFITTLPPAEPVDQSLTVFRPAHIHMKISAKGQQDLITQIYFQNDPHLATDPSTNSPLAINRILSTQKVDDNTSEIRFDISLKEEYVPEDSVFKKVSGIYKMSNGSMMEFYRDGDLLSYKTNNQIWGSLAYSGNNTFGTKEDDTEASFELQMKGAAKVAFRFSRRKETRIEGLKILDYNP